MVEILGTEGHVELAQICRSALLGWDSSSARDPTAERKCWRCSSCLCHDSACGTTQHFDAMVGSFIEEMSEVAIRAVEKCAPQTDHRHLIERHPVRPLVVELVDPRTGVGHQHRRVRCDHEL